MGNQLMPKAALIGSLMAAGAIAQSSFAIPGWKYVGCVEASPGIFDTKSGVSEPFFPAQCQAACGAIKANFAALGEGCHCDNKISNIAIEFGKVDFAQCSVSCVHSDPQSGQCGGPPPPAGKDFAMQVYNLYQRTGDDDLAAEQSAI